MNNLTLIIPAKFEAESLPLVLDEVKSLECKKIVILEPSDEETIKAIQKFDCKIVYQRNKGYGDALISGIDSVETIFFCIFNADGSFDPKYLKSMLSKCENFDFIFASRYLKDGGSEDDTFVTKFGNFFFSFLGNLLFSLSLSDILYTFIIGKTKSFKSLNLKSSDFCLCVEIPINAKKQKKNIVMYQVRKEKELQDLKR